MKNRFIIYYSLFLFVLFSLFIFSIENFFKYKDYRGIADSNNPNNDDFAWNYNRLIRLRLHNQNINEKIYSPKERIEPGLQDKFYQFSTDANGFIKPSIMHANPDFELVFMGGSTTENMFVEEKTRFPFLSGKMIEKKSSLKVNSINSSKSANNLMHNINILLNVIIPIQPDLVVLMNNYNDLYTFVNFKNYYWNDDPARSLILDVSESPINKNKLFNFKSFFPHTYLRIQKFKNKLFPSKKVIDKKVYRNNYEHFVDQYKKALMSFVEICKINNIKPVLMTQPSRFIENPDFEFSNDKISYNDLRFYHRYFNQIIRDVGNQNNLEIIDLESEILQTREYFYDQIHFNDQGNAAAAKIISDQILKNIIK